MLRLVQGWLHYQRFSGDPTDSFGFEINKWLGVRLDGGYELETESELSYAGCLCGDVLCPRKVEPWALHVVYDREFLGACSFRSTRS